MAVPVQPVPTLPQKFVKVMSWKRYCPQIKGSQQAPPGEKW